MKESGQAGAVDVRALRERVGSKTLGEYGRSDRKAWPPRRPDMCLPADLG